MVGQVQRRRLPHLTDPQGKQEARQGGAAGLVDGGHQIEGGFLPHPLETGQLDGVEAEQVRRGLHQPLVHQLLHYLVTQAVHIHGAAGREVLDRLLALRLAEQAAGAAGHRLPFQSLHRRATNRTLGGEEDLAGIHGALRLHHCHYLRDHIPRPAHYHGVADHDAKARYLVGIVQSGVGDGDAADEHRFELGHRGDGAGTADLELDVLQQGHLLLGRELVGRGPARGPGHETELLLQCYVVHLVDHAIDLVGQLAAAGQDVVVEGLTTGSALLELHLGAERQPPGLELVEASEVGVPQLVAAYAHAIGVEAQGAAGGDAGIKLAQTAGGGIARVDEHLLPCRLRLGIHRLETGLGHEDLPPHL